MALSFLNSSEGVRTIRIGVTGHESEITLVENALRELERVNSNLRIDRVLIDGRSTEFYEFGKPSVEIIKRVFAFIKKSAPNKRHVLSRLIISATDMSKSDIRVAKKLSALLSPSSPTSIFVKTLEFRNTTVTYGFLMTLFSHGMRVKNLYLSVILNNTDTFPNEATDVTLTQALKEHTPFSNIFKMSNVEQKVAATMLSAMRTCAFTKLDVSKISITSHTESYIKKSIVDLLSRQEPTKLEYLSIDNCDTLDNIDFLCSVITSKYLRGLRFFIPIMYTKQHIQQLINTILKLTKETSQLESMVWMVGSDGVTPMIEDSAQHVELFINSGMSNLLGLKIMYHPSVPNKQLPASTVAFNKRMKQHYRINRGASLAHRQVQMIEHALEVSPGHNSLSSTIIIDN